MKFTSSEKKAARKAFDSAYKREIKEIKTLLIEKISSIETDSHLWEIEDFLSQRRRMVDEKYDYRYSKLILVLVVY